MTAWLDGILVLVALEAAALWWWRRRADLLVNLLAGALLLLAMRAALGGGSLPVVGLCLAAAGAAHVLDLRARLKQ